MDIDGMINADSDKEEMELLRKNTNYWRFTSEDAIQRLKEAYAENRALDKQLEELKAELNRLTLITKIQSIAAP